MRSKKIFPSKIKWCLCGEESCIEYFADPNSCKLWRIISLFRTRPHNHKNWTQMRPVHGTPLSKLIFFGRLPLMWGEIPPQIVPGNHILIGTNPLAGTVIFLLQIRCAELATDGFVFCQFLGSRIQFCFQICYLSLFHPRLLIVVCPLCFPELFSTSANPASFYSSFGLLNLVISPTSARNPDTVLILSPLISISFSAIGICFTRFSIKTIISLIASGFPHAYQSHFYMR